MFEQLFGSGTRVKLIRLFLDNYGRRFYVRELTRLTDSMINSVRRELNNLIDLQLINFESPVDAGAEKRGAKRGLNTKKYYFLNEKNIFLSDLRNLFAKGKIMLEKRLVEKIGRFGELRYFAFGGVFVDDPRAAADVVIIGNLDAAKVKASMAKFEEDTGRPIRYTLIDNNEYRLRRDIADNFLDDVLGNPNNVVLVDRLERKKKKTDQYA